MSLKVIWIAPEPYIIPASVCLYADGYLNKPVTIKIESNKKWKFATGLEPVRGKPDEFFASDFDILYDCPILMGKLEELPSFLVKGIEHRFIGCQLGDFDRVKFVAKLKKFVEGIGCTHW